MRIDFSYDAAGFDRFAAAAQARLAKAATGAVKEAGALAQRNGRASIAAAGFSGRWQNALHVDVYPKGRDTINVAAVIRHGIPFAGVFESGDTIHGRPLLWIPITPNLPALGVGHWTPALYVRRVGPLASVNDAGHRPFLVDARPLRRGARRVVPLFQGVDQVVIRKRFDIAGAISDAARQLPALFAKHMNESE